MQSRQKPTNQERTKKMNNMQVAHLWASQNKNYGKGSNFFFEGTTIYSYGRHFPIARFVMNERGNRAALFTKDKWGPTTAKHINFARRSIPFGVPVFYAPELRMNPSPQEILRARVADFNESVEAVKRSRTSARQIFKAHAISREIEELCAFYGLENPLANEETRSVLQKLAEKRRSMAEKKKSKEKESIEKSVKRFFSDDSFHPNRYLMKIPPLLRRIHRHNSIVVQTSHGAEVKYEDAKRSFMFINRMWDEGKEWVRDVETHNVGPFELCAIGSDSVTIGCHKFERKEVERFAAQEGWL
jgi:hypothetical protein